MCGRFAITLPPEAMVQLFDAVPGNDLPPVPNFNVCPTNAVHVVRRGAAQAGDGEAGRRLVAMRWGVIPSWYKAPNDGPLLINARADTIAEKPAFRQAVRSRRCLIPASGFYEWTVTPDKARLPWYITRADDQPLIFAGIWQEWERDGQQLVSCAIVTCDANPVMARIHHRMPVILAPADIGLWLGEEGKGAAVLMRPAPEDALRFHRVDPAVNSNRASGPGLIEPIEAQG
ncbi:SOS response-associated peptidase [Frigidibacter sp. ROC022]|uniref:SOS response-associated peptidase n=1 Tax=Frigidibacter sp. ROC022 TaxID=2971796 RepID=UPI00215B4E6A|nr:SOS response-associated peptidase [Frigidibacter sp. ROC022]MCR8723158.1 SOS response-associated peptidase [Frigidibacter sp. ROC022]